MTIAAFIGLFVGLTLAISPVHVANVPAHEAEIPEPVVPEVPFYSQITDIEWPSWRPKSCGVAAVAMLADFYLGSGTVSPQELLEEGIRSGFYLENAGWIHTGLVHLAERRGLRGQTYDLSDLNMDSAFEKFSRILEEGPAIASVYSRFNPKSVIPHLAVITGIAGDTVYYNDPLDDTGGGAIPIADFKRGWKKRFIVIRS